MSIFDIYMALIKQPGVLATVYAFWILGWAYGIERKKFIGIGGCLLLMILSSLVGLL